MNNTLVKGLQLLEVLARSREPQGVSDLAAQLSLGKSNVHRLLQALVELGYVLKDETTAQYQVSLRLWELGAAVEVGFRIKAAASEAMGRLLSRTREQTCEPRSPAPPAIRATFASKVRSRDGYSGVSAPPPTSSPSTPAPRAQCRA